MVTWVFFLLHFLIVIFIVQSVFSAFKCFNVRMQCIDSAHSVVTKTLLFKQKNNRSLVAFSVRPLEDMNEITSHMLEVVQAHMLLSKPQTMVRGPLLYKNHYTSCATVQLLTSKSLFKTPIVVSTCEYVHDVYIAQNTSH